MRVGDETGAHLAAAENDKVFPRPVFKSELCHSAVKAFACPETRFNALDAASVGDENGMRGIFVMRHSGAREFDGADTGRAFDKGGGTVKNEVVLSGI